MRIWAGKEVEGDKTGIFTIFVEDSNIGLLFTDVFLNTFGRSKQYVTTKISNTNITIDSSVNSNRFKELEANRIYLGAGRVSPKDYQGLDAFCTFAYNHGISDIVLEVDVNDFNLVPNWFKINHQVIVRFDTKQEFFGNVAIKLDNDQVVYVKDLSNFKATDLDSLGDNMLFANDILVAETVEKDHKLLLK